MLQESVTRGAKQWSKMGMGMFNYDYWANPEEHTDITFFLPNGVLIILKYSIYTTLQDLKAVSEFF